MIFDNLKKSIAFSLASNVPEIIPFLVFIVFDIPLPFTILLLLCIELGTNIVPAMSFAIENPENDILDITPKDNKRS